MIRENQKFLNKVQVIIDMTIIVISFLLAYYIRFYILNGYKSMDFSDLFIPILVSIPMYLLLYTIFELYTAKRTTSVYKEIFDIIKVNFVAALILILGLYVFKIINFSRVTLALFVILNTTITSINRLCLRYTLRKYRKKGLNQKHCLIIGATNTSKELIHRINKNKHWGYNVVGIIDNHKNKGEDFEDFKILGNFKDVKSILDNKHIDLAFITIAAEEFVHIGSLLKDCERAGIKTNIIPYYHKYVPAKPRMDDLDGLAMIDTRHVPLDSYFMSLSKRMFDIVFSLFAIILVSPIMVLSVIMIKLTSPGPVIYKQERVGLNRKKFYMYKFRSMKVQTEEEEKTKWSTKNDPRKTKWGSFMRKTSIDELPQFFNVLKGDMSIIGPRPERPYFVEKFRDEIPRYMIKHQVRPGITGWAQVSGFRGDTSIEGRIEHDLEYIENWTFFFDIKIVFLTIFKGFINKNAY